MTTTPTTSILLDAGDPGVDDPAVVGTKAATLAALRGAGFEVPDFVVLSTAACEAARAAAVPGDPPQATPPVRAALEAAADRFGDAPLAVRSSSPSEDGAEASHAGQYETVLGVRGAEALATAVETCWASATTASAAAYDRDHGGDGAPAMAVVIQRQVDADVAGVAFGADPVTGDRDVVVIDAVDGLGDRLVAGEVSPERWRVDADGPHVEHRRGEADRAGALDERTAERVAQLVRDLGRRQGAPQDVEWAFAGDRLWLLQSRPVTALPDAPAAPVPIPVEVPEGTWIREISHAPHPHSPFHRMFIELQVRGARHLGDEYGMLFEGVDFREIGGWQYIRMVPIGGKDRPPPPAWTLPLLTRLVPVLRRRAKLADTVLRERRPQQLIERWYDELRPELVSELERLRDTDRTDLDDEALDAHLVESRALYFRFGDVKMLLHVAADMLTLFELREVCAELFDWDEAKIFDLVVGLSPASTAPSSRWRELIRMAAERPAVAAAFEAGTPTLDELTALDADLGQAIHAYLDEFGRRTLRYDPIDPTVAEAPDLLVGLLRDGLRTGGHDGDGDVAAARRAATEAEARAALAAAAPVDQQRFDDVLERARRAYPVREDSGCIGFEIYALLRYVAHEFGRRLQDRGQLDRVEDAFFLEADELRDALRDGAPRHELVTRRRGERRWASANPGPAVYGSEPPAPPPMDKLPAGLRFVTEGMLWAIDRMAELERSGTPQQDDDRLTGVAASSGRYTGTVRVIRAEEEFDKLRAGDVVVCPITSPTWSILFPSIGALVTDTGGVLSHPAIIAREYGIPAVVATGNATDLLRDGELVSVDGDNGVVRRVRSG